MALSALLRLGDALGVSLRPQWGPAVDAPPIDVRCLQARWQAEQIRATTGFMTLHAVREAGRVVDFEVDRACDAALVLLCGGRHGALGPRLAQVLDGHAERREVFDLYRHVLQFGAARSGHHRVQAPVAMDVLRHTAVRLADGLVVTLTNVSAVRRLWTLRHEIESRALIDPSRPP